MRFELTDTIGQFAVLVLMLTIGIKLWFARLDERAFKDLLKFLCVVVFGVWLIKLMPRDIVQPLDMSGCDTFDNWTECSGWPIFMSPLATLGRYVGDTLVKLVTFGPQLAGFLAALYYVMRVNTGRFKDAEGVWKTTVGVLLIFATVLYLPWISKEANAIVSKIFGLGETFDQGRENLNAYLTAVNEFKKASDAYSSSLLDLPYHLFRGFLWVVLLVPSVVGIFAYLGQLLILYGVPYAIFLVIFTQWQDLSLPFSLILRGAGASFVKGLTWVVVSKLEAPKGVPTNEWEMVSFGSKMWSGSDDLLYFAAIYAASGWILVKFILGPALQTLFNPRST